MNGTATLAVSVGPVASEACSRWTLSGEAAELLRWDQFVGGQDGDDWTGCGISEVVVVSDARAIDCVLEPERDWEQLNRAFEHLDERGWQITLLVPLIELGAAHEALRGANARIQGWWRRNRGALSFTSHELA